MGRITILGAFIFVAGCTHVAVPSATVSSVLATAAVSHTAVSHVSVQPSERTLELLDGALPPREKEQPVALEIQGDAEPVTLAWAGQAAPSPARPSASGPPSTAWSLQTSVGFTIDPSGFLGAIELDYEVAREFRVGPLVQFGAGDDHSIVAPTINMQYVLDLSVFDESLATIRPYGQGGIGFAWIDKTHRSDDIGFLINMGFGLEWEMTERLTVGNNVLFNVMPDDVAGDNFFFSWQFLALRFRF